MFKDRIANLLYELTIKNAAVWFCRKVDVNWFYCFTNNEKITIKVFVTDEDNCENCLEESQITFFLHYRDAEFMYVGDLYNGDKLVKFMKSTPVDDVAYEQMNTSW